MTSAADSPRPEPAEHRAGFDPEFDRARSWRRQQVPRTGLLPQEYQRLVANPFLAVAAFSAYMVSFLHAIDTKNFALMLFSLALGVSGVFLFQYHCLDCGKTGCLFRWKRHACEHVVARQILGRTRRFRGPRPTIQTIIWGYLTLVAIILLAVALNPRK